jgi:hypothetical protein
MMDVEARYSRLDILESGDARARVHWHYALCNPEYEIFNGNTTADEYYTVYPDGIAVRRLVGWPGNESDYGGNPSFWELGEFIMSYPGERKAFESGVSRETLLKEREKGKRDSRDREVVHNTRHRRPRDRLLLADALSAPGSLQRAPRDRRF